MSAPAILIIAPTRRELGGLRDKGAGHRTALCGVGREAGERAAALLDAAPCSLLVSLGFAGALDPSLRPGDLIEAEDFALTPPLSHRERELGVPTSLSRSAGEGGAPPLTPSLSQRERGSSVSTSISQREDGAGDPILSLRSTGLESCLTPSPAGRERDGARVDAPTELSPRRRESRRREAPLLSHPSAASFPRKREPTGAEKLRKGARAGATAGAILTVDAPLLTPAAKRRAREASGAMAVDMEGRWIADAAAARRVPLISVRAVVDEADFEIPPFAAAIAADGGRRERARAIRAAVNPLEARRILALAWRARKAARSLRRAADAVLSAPPERL